VRDETADMRVADTAVKTPWYSAEYKAMPVPRVAHVAPKTGPYFAYSNLESYNKYHKTHTCVIARDTVHTFDRAEYDLPETDCYKVVAKDCSTNNLFTVLVKKAAGFRKAVKIIIDTAHVIEFIPDGDKTTMVYNGESKADPPNGVVFNPKSPQGHELFYVKKYNDKYTHFESRIYGFHVALLTDAIDIQVAPFYRGKMCGLCGNYNLDKQHEWRGAKGCLHHTPYSFARTYALPDETCKVPEERALSIDGKPDCDFAPEKM